MPIVYVSLVKCKIGTGCATIFKDAVDEATGKSGGNLEDFHSLDVCYITIHHTVR